MHGQVVVIDDKAAMLDVLRQVLEMEGFSVLGIKDPGGMKWDRPGLHPALFLVDVAVSGNSGVEVAEQLRKTHFPSTPMIAMAASRTMVQHVAQSGVFDGVLEKPFDAPQLLTAIEQRLAAAA